MSSMGTRTPKKKIKQVERLVKLNFIDFKYILDANIFFKIKLIDFSEVLFQ